MPGSRHALLLLASAMLLAMTTWFSATAVLPQLRTAWTLTTLQASFLTIAVQAGFVAGALVSAFVNLADIIAARTLMLLGALGVLRVVQGEHSGVIGGEYVLMLKSPARRSRAGLGVQGVAGCSVCRGDLGDGGSGCGVVDEVLAGAGVAMRAATAMSLTGGVCRGRPGGSG